MQILSGVFEGLTTGAPIGLLIVNEDARSKDYGRIKELFRPGHADFTYQAKYGIRDYRGGGRSSARETAVRVAAGAIARKVLGAGVRDPRRAGADGPARHRPRPLGLGGDRAQPVLAPDAAAAEAWAEYLDGVRKAGSSAGGIVEVVASGVPVGLGAPVFDRLDADIAKAMVSIPAVKGVEIGSGFAGAARSGPENNDEMRMEDGRPVFLSNNAGGVLGGISTGQDIVVRVAIKPTSSVVVPAADREPRRRGRRDRHHRPPRPVRRHPRRAGVRGDAGAGPRRPLAAPQGPVRLSGRRRRPGRLK